MDISNANDLAAIEVDLELIQSTVTKVSPLQVKNGVSATLAASCLINPQIGDTVACTRNASGDVFIFSILKRMNPDSGLLVSMNAPLTIEAPSIEVVSSKISVVAEDVASNIGTLKRLINHAEDIVDSFVASFDKIFIRANSSIRRVEDLDELSAGHIKIDSPALVEISGEVTTIAGEELIKLQGQQIHMG